MKNNVFNRTLSEHRLLVDNLTSPIAPADVFYKEYKYFTVYRPKEIKKLFPTLLYIPGNAFVASENSYTHFICSHITQQSRCQVIVVKHRLAPEFQFPIGFQDAYQIINLLLNKKNPLNIDKTQVAISGYSSGGNLAALIAIQAKKQNLPIARQILISPITDLSRSLKGFEKFENQDTAISEQFVKWFLNLYIPKNIKITSSKISPYWTSNSSLKELPITDLIFGEFDRFRSDAELYGKRLLEQKNVVNYFMFKKENHGLIWHNIAVIKTISARLALSFGTEPIERSISNQNYNRIYILKLVHYYQSLIKNKKKYLSY